MLRLKANKTSLYKLVSKYVPMPIMRWAEFRKVPYSPVYFLDWHQENGYAQAVFAICMGRPMLSVTVRDIDGHQLSRDVFHPTLEDLRQRGMIEEVAERGA